VAGSGGEEVVHFVFDAHAGFSGADFGMVDVVDVGGIDDGRAGTAEFVEGGVEEGEDFGVGGFVVVGLLEELR